MTPRAHITLVDDMDIETLPVPGSVIDQVIPAQGLVVLVGKPGVGKTFLALDWAFRITTGMGSWSGFMVTAGPVIYIAAEGAAGLRLRVPAWKRRHQRPGKAGVLFMPHVLDLLDEAQVLEFLDVASDVSPPLVIIDTLARCLAGGDENSAAHMGRLVGNADRIRKELNCTVLLLHHPTKQGKSERGHSALRGACDTVVKLAGARHSLLLKCEKQKDAEHFADISLHLDQVSLGDGLTSCVMVPTEDGQVSGVLPAPDRTALAALNTLPSGTATFGEWNAKAGIAERTLHRAADRLRSLGYLEKPEGKRGQHAITEEGRAVLGKAPLRTAI